LQESGPAAGIRSEEECIPVGGTCQDCQLHHHESRYNDNHKSKSHQRWHDRRLQSSSSRTDAPGCSDNSSRCGSGMDRIPGCLGSASHLSRVRASPCGATGADRGRLRRAPRHRFHLRQGFLLAGTRASSKLRPNSWVIKSGVFQSMDALRFGTAAAAWLIRGQNRAAIMAPWVEAGVHTVVRSFGFWRLPAGAPPSRRFHWIPEGPQGSPAGGRAWKSTG
jgi:hypothetical protein